jgi:hypothetical protein
MEARKLNIPPKLYQINHLPAALKCKYFVCKKHFPKPVNDAKVESKLDENGIVVYLPPRDDGMVNNYHGAFMHYWGANTDIQVLHESM